MQFNFKKAFSVIAPLVVLSLLLVFPELSELIENYSYTQILGTADEQGFEQVLVKRVVDGDTIELSDGRKLRYIGIDTPETKHPSKGVECFGKEASEYNKNLVENKIISIEKDISETDRYARLLRYVWLDDEMINKKLVEEGYAHASSYPPDIKYQDELREAERKARENNLGLWSKCQE
ncbi:MAG: thermonuclease family protein [Patescibacteria group bacterium]